MLHDSNSPAFVVLGGTGGIGSALCERLRARGWRVTVAARSEVATQALAKRLDARAATCDATSRSAVEACLSEARDAHGRLDGVANCVGSIILKPAHLTTDAEWDETIRTNLTSAFATVSAAAKCMPAGGSVVLCATAAAMTGLANQEAIAAAKGGVIALMRSAAATYAPRNLRVNAVAPGLVRTKLAAKITANEASLRASEQMHALGRIGEPGHVASMIEWLLDPANDWITGQAIGVDGGLSSVRPRMRS